jgi:hypothetical protein
MADDDLADLPAELLEVHAEAVQLLFHFIIDAHPVVAPLLE